MRFNGSIDLVGVIKNLRPETFTTAPLTPDGVAPFLYIVQGEEEATGTLVYWNGSVAVPISSFGQLREILDANEFEITNLGEPTADSSAARLADIKNAVAALAFKGQVNGILNSNVSPVEGVYILGNYAVEDLDVGDIVEFDGEDFTLVYAVDDLNRGSLVWSVADNGYLELASAGWRVQRVATSDPHTYSNNSGLQISGSAVSLKLKAGGGLSLSNDGLAVDTSGFATALTVASAINDVLVQFDSEDDDVSFTVQHNRNNRYPMVQVISKTTGKIIIPDDITFTDANNLTVTLGVADTVIINVLAPINPEEPE